MFRIRQEQMDVMADHRLALFKDRLVEHLGKVLPGRGVDMDAEQIRAQVDAGIARAGYYNLRRECDVALYIEIACSYMAGFAESHPVDAKRILYDDRLSPEDKLARLEQWATQSQSRDSTP